MSIKALRRRHFRELLALEKQAAEALRPAWARALASLTRALAALPDGPAQDRRGAVEDACRAALESLAVALPGPLLEQARAAVRTGMRQTMAEVAALERTFGEAATADALEAFEPLEPATFPTAAEKAAPMVGTKRAVNPFRAVAQELRDRLWLDSAAKALDAGITLGENLRDITKRLVGVLEGEWWQLERIARTEVNNAMNAGHAEAIGQTAGRFPRMGLRQQWSAHWDNRTSKVCRTLNGQVQDAGGEFSAAGWTGKRPPAHPNCRSRLNPWCARWEEAEQPRTDEQIAADEAAWMAQRQAERAARRAARRRPAAAKGISAREGDFTYHLKRMLDPCGAACCSTDR